MNVLLEECVDRRFAREIVGHRVVTVPNAGWSGLKNGDLLGVAQTLFDVLVTVDRNLPHERDLTRYKIAVVVLRANTNRVQDLKPLAAKLLQALTTITAGEVMIVA